MVKYFCDRCKQEMPNSDRGDRPKITDGRWTLEIMHALGNTWNDGCLCLSCHKEILAKWAATPTRKPKRRAK